MTEYFYVVILVRIIGLVDAADWGYWGENGPENWPGICRTGKYQSPINIATEDAIRIDLGSLKFLRYDFAFSGTVTNTGHSIQVNLGGIPIHLTGASLPATYVLEQMHFHWDAEHTIDGFRDPLELHFVHYDNQYGNISTASQHENGIVVVAAMFQISNQNNTDLTPILEATELVSKWVGSGSTADIRTKVIPYLFLPKDHTTYYRYEGSLTTPMCYESVMWFILTEKLTVSWWQMNVFMNVQSADGTLKYNYRPVQKIGGRKIFHHLEGYSAANSNTFLSNLPFTILSVFLVQLLRSSDF